MTQKAGMQVAHDSGPRTYARGRFKAPQYTIASGDALSGIALRFGVSVADIKAANRLVNDTIYAGKKLQISGKGDTTPERADHGRREFATGTFKMPHYTVAAGDALSGIALRFGVSVQDIKAANGLTSDAIDADQTLLIPGDVGLPEGFDRGPREHAAGTFKAPKYAIASGDALSAIALRFGVTVSDIKTANKLTNDTIYVGHDLVIPGSGS